MVTVFMMKAIHIVSAGLGLKEKIALQLYVQIIVVREVNAKMALVNAMISLKDLTVLSPNARMIAVTKEDAENLINVPVIHQIMANSVKKQTVLLHVYLEHVTFQLANANAMKDSLEKTAERSLAQLLTATTVEHVASKLGNVFVIFSTLGRIVKLCSASIVTDIVCMIPL